MFIRCPAKVVGSSMQIFSSDVTLTNTVTNSAIGSKPIKSICNLWEDFRHNLREVHGEAPHALVNPLHRERGVAEAWYSRLHPGCVTGGVSRGVVDQGHVLRPALDLEGDHLVDVEPEVVPVARLGAPPVRGAGLVEPRLYLRAAVPGDEDDWVEAGTVSSLCSLERMSR